MNLCRQLRIGVGLLALIGLNAAGFAAEQPVVPQDPIALEQALERGRDKLAALSVGDETAVTCPTPPCIIDPLKRCGQSCCYMSNPLQKCP